MRLRWQKGVSFVYNSFGGHASPSVRGIPQRRSNLFLTWRDTHHDDRAPRLNIVVAVIKATSVPYPPGFLLFPST
jgi:hypothetical protein